MSLGIKTTMCFFLLLKQRFIFLLTEVRYVMIGWERMCHYTTGKKQKSSETCHLFIELWHGVIRWERLVKSRILMESINIYIYPLEKLNLDYYIHHSSFSHHWHFALEFFELCTCDCAEMWDESIQRDIQENFILINNKVF